MLRTSIKISDIYQMKYKSLNNLDIQFQRIVLIAMQIRLFVIAWANFKSLGKNLSRETAKNR